LQDIQNNRDFKTLPHLLKFGKQKPVAPFPLTIPEISSADYIIIIGIFPSPYKDFPQNKQYFYRYLSLSFYRIPDKNRLDVYISLLYRKKNTVLFKTVWTSPGNNLKSGSFQAAGGHELGIV
jgi:hypothetical protein